MKKHPESEVNTVITEPDQTADTPDEEVSAVTDEQLDRLASSKFEVVQLTGRQTFSAIAHDVKPIAPWLVLCVIVSIASVVLVTFAPLYVGNIIDIINDCIHGGVFDSEAFTKNLIFLSCFYVGYAIFSILKTYLMNMVMSQHFNNKLRIKMSEKIMRLPVSYVDKTGKGELIERMTDDVSVIGSTIHNVVDLAVTGFFQLVLILVFSFRADWHMALVVLALVPVCVTSCMLIARRSDKYFAKYMDRNGKLYSVIEETYSGMKTVRSYGMERFMQARHAKINSDIKTAGVRGYTIIGSLSPLMVLITVMSFALVCLIGGYMFVSGVGITIGSIVALVMYAQQLQGPLQSIAGSMSMVQRAKTSSKRIYGMLALSEMDTQSADAEFKCDTIEFKDMSFGYVPDVPVIKNLNLKVERGQKVAIVGPTGGGKTTIVNLLMRFYDPDSGSILIDGIDTRSVDRDKVRDCFDMVLQDTWLFGGTVADNVAYGAPDASREDIERACRAAYCDGFISTLKDGYDTAITQGATNISQGQKQLLTIARAFMAERPILILDEATSNVDTRTEILLQRAMDKLMTGRTCFVIAHRLSTIINADVILVVNNGEIIERGTHGELMAKNGFYADMFNSQYNIG